MPFCFSNQNLVRLFVTDFVIVGFDLSVIVRPLQHLERVYDLGWVVKTIVFVHIQPVWFNNACKGTGIIYHIHINSMILR